MAHDATHFDTAGTCACECPECYVALRPPMSTCICPDCNAEVCGLHDEEG